MAKRPYSREFTPRTERRVELTVSRVPPTLKEAAQSKARRLNLSLRNVMLRLLKRWVDDEIEVDGKTED